MGNVCTSQKSVSAFEPFKSATGVATPVSQVAPVRNDSEHQAASTSKETATSQESNTVVYEDASLPAESTSTITGQQSAIPEGMGTASSEIKPYTEHLAQETPEVSQETSSSEPPPFSPPANYRARRRCSVRAFSFFSRSSSYPWEQYLDILQPRTTNVFPDASLPSPLACQDVQAANKRQKVSALLGQYKPLATSQ
jgi:rRNA maturation protein Nop10